jgi:hypothetical protein
MFCGRLFIFVGLLLAIVLVVLPLFTAADYSFYIYRISGESMRHVVVCTYIFDCWIQAINTYDPIDQY